MQNIRSYLQFVIRLTITLDILHFDKSYFEHSSGSTKNRQHISINNLTTNAITDLDCCWFTDLIDNNVPSYARISTIRIASNLLGKVTLWRRMPQQE